MGYLRVILTKVIQELVLSDGVRLQLFRDREEASVAVVDELDGEIRRRDRLVLGLATGSTPLQFYKELVRRHREEGLSLAGVEGFNLDEYEGLSPDHPQSYHAFMQESLYGQVDAHGAHLPPGVYQDAERACADYEARIQAAGGIDWQLLAIGANGHIAFNEPGSAVDSRTRRIELDERTRRDAVKSFGSLEQVPRAALTMGVGTVLEARRIVLMAWGEGKSEILQRALQEEVTTEVPASHLQRHGNVWIVADLAAGGWALS